MLITILQRTLLVAWLVSLPLSQVRAAEPSLYLTIEIQVKPGMRADFIEMMNRAALDTRAFDGNQHFAILVDNEDPTRVFFYEVWESKEALAAYRAWRDETKFGEKAGPFFAGPPISKEYTLASD